jgi:protein-S-isoprenylcysteine O-methyltransferase Ste14
MRHPIYTGLLTFALGVGLDAGIPQLIFVAALFVLINRKARWEEELLMQRYPEYAEYMSKTPRFLPRLKG